MPFEKLMIHKDLLMKLCIDSKVHLHIEYLETDSPHFISDQEVRKLRETADLNHPTSDFLVCS